ncbi:MAG: endopeptidase La, partial [Clostridiales bacterium]|nr:endopeptidase La [Clostridiales bacterium]
MADTKKQPETPDYERLPLLALRGLCAFPGVLLNFDIERDISTLAIDAANSQGRRVFLVAQKDIMKESPKPDDLYKIGTICHIKQMLKMPGGGIKALVEGIARARIITVGVESGYYVTEVEPIAEPAAKKSVKIEALMRRCVGMFDTYASFSAVISREVVFPLFTMTQPGKIADYIVQHMLLRHDQKQPVLEAIRPLRRLEIVADLLAREIEIQGIEHEIEENIRTRLEGQQREHILREQLHAIQMELGEERGEPSDDISNYRRKVSQLSAPQEVTEKLFKEVDKLEKLHFGSAEASVIGAYLDTCLELPWSRQSKERRDIALARRVLDDDHYGLDQVKERIIELLSVRQMNPGHKGT